MNISDETQLFFAFVAIAVVIPSVIAFFGLKLADQNGTDVRIVWYLFSLTVVVTCIVTAWAVGFGAIDNRGEFQGELGAAIHTLLKFMLDLDADFKIFLSILLIVLLPQVTSYVLSGLFGCASAPIFVGGTISVFIWALVKSFVCVAGILLSIALYGYFNNWNGWSGKGAASMLSMSGFLLMLSFFMLYVYRDIHATINKPSPHKFPKIQKTVAALQDWLTRKLPRN